MPHCTKCGEVVAETAAFCQSCGHPQGTTFDAGAKPGAQPGLTENAAALLSYAFFWVSGLIFLLIDKRPYVRFHAAQSLVLFGALHIASLVLGVAFGMSWWFGGWRTFSIGAAVIGLVRLAGLVLWIVCMIKAWQGERFRVPIAADLADSIVGK